MRQQHFQRLVVVLSAVLAAGCASLNASSAIADGSDALSRAERQDASKYARYTYTKASLMLNAAKVRNGYGEYDVARRWAEQASDLARDAERTAKSRKNLEEQKRRIKRASERVKQGTPKPKPPTTPKAGQPKQPPATDTPPPKDRPKLLPPPRNKRKLLPPKRSSGETP